MYERPQVVGGEVTEGAGPSLRATSNTNTNTNTNNNDITNNTHSHNHTSDHNARDPLGPSIMLLVTS